MSRLTNHFDYCDFIGCKYANKELARINQCEFFNMTSRDKCHDRKIYEKLREYEDLEEQGMLIELPCKPDEVVYAAHKDCRTVKVAYASIEHILADLEAGWCIGYTKAEAEQKLAELKGGGE